MKSAIAVLTYRRRHTLQTMLDGLAAHCPFYRTAIFEDCGQRDDTADFLQLNRVPHHRLDLLAYEYKEQPQEGPVPLPVTAQGVQVFMGERNLGVACNSNRALKWFMDETDADHLCLCNDDLLVAGDFVKFYGQGHTDLNVGLWCFCDFTHHESYRWTTYRVRGYGVKFLPRFTGIMMSITRKLVEEVGYFDASFGQFGEEHCDYTIRCRFAGGIRLDGHDMNCLDLEHPLLRHQDCQTSVTGAERLQADKHASVVMAEAVKTYSNRHHYRPFRLVQPKMAGGYSGGGIPVENLLECGYKLVTALAP